MAAEKKCGRCGEVKGLGDFPKNRTKPGGWDDRCKKCKKAHYEANKERVAESQKAYREANKERLAEYGKARRTTHKDLINQRHRAYREANLERIKRRVNGHTAALDPAYVAKLLARGLDLKPSDIPPALVELKREHLKITRHLKELQHENS